MGWNGSDGSSAATSARKPINKTQTPSAMRGIVAGLAVVAIACGGLFYILLGEKEKTPSAKPSTGRIVEMKSAPVAPTKSEPKKQQRINVSSCETDRTLSAPERSTHPVVTNAAKVVQIKSKHSIFEFHCENQIAGLLMHEPGATLVGTQTYNGRFTKQFLESLETPIVINDDDSEEHKELKRNVIQAKKDLKAAYDRGEDIEKIMLDTRKELQDLARYKRELRGMVFEYNKTEGVSEQDIDDYVQAANKMLEEKGIAPLDPGPLARRKLRMQMLEERKNNK